MFNFPSGSFPSTNIIDVVTKHAKILSYTIYIRNELKYNPTKCINRFLFYYVKCMLQIKYKATVGDCCLFSN